MSRYIVQTGNENAGADANIAQTTFHIADTVPGVGPSTAQLIAFMQYLSPGAGCYIRSVLRGEDAPGPTFPVEFPVDDYALLHDEDLANLAVMEDYGVAYGTGALAPIGVGIVLTKRTELLGRTGRGRLTTPWLASSAVTAVGVALNAAISKAVTGWNAYITGGVSYTSDLTPFIYPSSAVVTQLTGTARLGKVRTRSA